MPMKSLAQNAAMHAAENDPEVAKKLGIPQKVASEFVSAQHGHSLKGLPQHVQRKAQGGPITVSAYPRTFKW